MHENVSRATALGGFHFVPFEILFHYFILLFFYYYLFYDSILLFILLFCFIALFFFLLHCLFYYFILLFYFIICSINLLYSFVPLFYYFFVLFCFGNLTQVTPKRVCELGSSSIRENTIFLRDALPPAGDVGTVLGAHGNAARIARKSSSTQPGYTPSSPPETVTQRIWPVLGTV